MKQNIVRLAAMAALTLGISGVFAAEAVTITGEGKCAKCCLKEADKCQNVVEVKKGDKVTKYYLTGPVSKAYHHDNLCSAVKKVTVTGKVEEKDGKMTMTVEKIDEAK